MASDPTQSRNYKSGMERLLRKKAELEGWSSDVMGASGARDLGKMRQGMAQAGVREEQGYLDALASGQDAKKPKGYDEQLKEIDKQIYQRNLRLYQYDPSKFEYGPAASADFTKLNTQDANQFRGDQRGLVEALKARMAGTAPSVAEQQLKQGQEATVGNIYGMAASQRGVNPALAARQAGLQAASSLGDMNRQASMLRAQEQQGAEQLLGSVLQGARAQDESRALGSAQLDQQTRLANLQAMLDARRAQQAGRMTLEQLKGSDVLNLQQLLLQDEAQRRAQANAWKTALIGGGLQAGGAIGASFAGQGGA